MILSLMPTNILELLPGLNQTISESSVFYFYVHVVFVCIGLFVCVYYLSLLYAWRTETDGRYLSQSLYTLFFG